MSKTINVTISDSAAKALDRMTGESNATESKIVEEAIETLDTLRNTSGEPVGELSDTVKLFYVEGSGAWTTGKWDAGDKCETALFRLPEGFFAEQYRNDRLGVFSVISANNYAPIERDSEVLLMTDDDGEPYLLVDDKTFALKPILKEAKETE